MAIYLSAGPSTIAALMVVDRMNASPAAGTRPADSAPTAGILCDCETTERSCEKAVFTAYRDLRLHGTPKVSAFQACASLYRTHHPEASPSEAQTLVTAWLQELAATAASS